MICYAAHRSIHSSPQESKTRKPKQQNSNKKKKNRKRNETTQQNNVTMFTMSMKHFDFVAPNRIAPKDKPRNRDRHREGGRERKRKSIHIAEKSRSIFWISNLWDL